MCPFHPQKYGVHALILELEKIGLGYSCKILSLTHFAYAVNFLIIINI